ncbi:MAG: hypothetical protein DMG98_26850 [Acidobacteria bacterium]|nr:MAG: hypothetical protein DMG98_26850 [Acidobacteriota bacterium]
MQQSNISFQARCAICNETVTAMLLLKREEVDAAVRQNADVTVMHLAPDGDHVWALTDQEKTRLRNRIADGTL